MNLKTEEKWFLMTEDSERLARIEERTTNLQEEIKDIKRLLKDGFVRREEFDPIKKLVYGVVTIVVGGVFLAIMSLVLRAG